MLKSRKIIEIQANYLLIKMFEKVMTFNTENDGKYFNKTVLTYQHQNVEKLFHLLEFILEVISLTVQAISQSSFMMSSIFLMEERTVA